MKIVLFVLSTIIIVVGTWWLWSSYEENNEGQSHETVDTTNRACLFDETTQKIQCTCLPGYYYIDSFCRHKPSADLISQVYNGTNGNVTIPDAPNVNFEITTTENFVDEQTVSESQAVDKIPLSLEDGTVSDQVSHQISISDSTIEKSEVTNGSSNNSDNSNNVSESSVTSLLVNDGTTMQYTIWKFQIETQTRSLGKSVISNVREQKDALEINCENKKIYFFYRTTRVWSIKEIFYDGSNERNIIYGIDDPFAIAINWITQELYWTDAGRKTINVANLTSLETKELVNTSPDFQPRGIAFHPRLRKLYWLTYDLEKKSSILEVADKSGLNRKQFLNDVINDRAHHLTIDWNSNDLCWTTDSNICCANIETKVVKTIYTDDYPFLLKVSSDGYYWTSAYRRSVYYVDKNLRTFERLANFGSAEYGDIRGMALVEDNTCPFNISKNF